MSQSLKEIEHARRLDHEFRNMDLTDLPIGKPIDERSLISAASDPNTITMENMKRLQEATRKNSVQRVKNTWSQMASRLPATTPASHSMPVPESAPVIRSDIPQRKNYLLKTYQDMATDLRNFKTLPYKTNLEKLSACFLGQRSYLSITTFVAICIVLIIILLLCFRRRSNVD